MFFLHWTKTRIKILSPMLWIIQLTCHFIKLQNHSQTDKTDGVQTLRRRLPLTNSWDGRGRRMSSQWVTDSSKTCGLMSTWWAVLIIWMRMLQQVRNPWLWAVFPSTCSSGDVGSGRSIPNHYRGGSFYGSYNVRWRGMIVQLMGRIDNVRTDIHQQSHHPRFCLVVMELILCFKAAI